MKVKLVSTAQSLIKPPADRNFTKSLDKYMKFSTEEDSDRPVSYYGGWYDCKEAVLEILDKYSHTIGAKYIRNEIEKL